MNCSGVSTACGDLVVLLAQSPSCPKTGASPTARGRASAVRPPFLSAGSASAPGRAGSVDQRVDERLGIERGQVVRALAEPDELHRDAERPLHGDDDAA